MILRPFEPIWLVYTKRILLGAVVVGAYLWVSTDEYEFESETVPYVRENIPTISEPEEPELPVYAEPEQAIPGWIVPPEPVRKKVAKVKRKIKKTVKTD